MCIFIYLRSIEKKAYISSRPLALYKLEEIKGFPLRYLPECAFGNSSLKFQKHDAFLCGINYVGERFHRTYVSEGVGSLTILDVHFKGSFADMLEGRELRKPVLK